MHLVFLLFLAFAAAGAADAAAQGPSISIDSPTVTEGDSGSSNLTFTVTLSAVSTEQVRVRFSDKGTGTATAGTDYPAFLLQWVRFQPGELTKTVSISVTGDTVKEPNETIVVELLYPRHATIATPTGTGTITDDDTTPGLSISSPRVTEGNSGSKNLTYTVSLTAASTQQVTVDYADAGTGTATSGTDYTAITGGTLTFAVGTTSQTFNVSVTGDTDVEPHETVVVSLSNASGATISTASGTGTIVNDDGASSLSVSSLSVVEANTAIRFTVTLGTARSESVRVTWWDTREGTATADLDYSSPGYNSPGLGWLTFAPGEVSKTTNQIWVREDGREESDETIIVAASVAADGSGRVTGTATIEDDDGPALSIDSPSVTEGDSGSKTLTFTVKLDKAAAEQVTVDYADAGTGTATSGTDYTAITGGTLTFAAGTTSQTFNVSVTGDADEEPNETVVAMLSNAANAMISTATGTGTIVNDDGVTVSIDSPSVIEGNSGSKNLTFTATLSKSSAQQVTVNYADAGTGTAISGTDYTAITGGTLTFAAGTTSQTFNVSVTGDTTDEADETVIVTLSNAANATILTATGTGTITDDDRTPSLSIDSPSVTEGDSGSTTLTFTVTLNKVSADQVTVDYADAGTGTATSGTDYTAITGGSLTFAAGTTSQTFDVSVTGDTTDEADETVKVTLSNAANATFFKSTGTGTITDNDDAPSLSIDSPSVTEGDSGSKNLTFTATLSAASGQQVTVDWAEGTGGTATSGTDYGAISGGTLTFAIGTTSQTFNVSVTGDTDEEPNETVVAMLSNATNATIATATGTGTIVNDDGVTISIDSPSVTEGDSGSKTLTFTATLNKASAQQVTVNYADAGTGTATSGTDYTAITGGVLTFPVGTTSQTFDVSVTGDTTEEPNETVVAMLSNAANATISTATGTGTIVNDDGVTVSIDSPSVTEGDSGSTNLTFTATLNRASTQQVTVNYADAGTGTAISGTDYTAITGGTLTFAVGITSQTFDVSVTGDTTDEADETVVVTLSNAANATISTATGTGTITNDDGVTVSIDSPSVTEGDSGSTTLTFTATLSKASTQQVTVDYADAGTGTATSGTDYTAITGGTLTFAVGTTSQTFDVSVTGDTDEETDETVIVTLSNAANATISTATGTGTITDNDDAPTLSINSPRVNEGDSGSTNLTYTVSLAAASGQQVTVDWAEGTGGTATSGTDYGAISGGTLTFAIGTTSQTFDVSVTGDTDEEPNETVVAMLSNATNATIATATGTGTIVNDDGLPALSINSPRVTEGDSGSKNLTFTVTLNKAGVDQVTVDWAEGTGGTATSGTDYTVISGGTLTFAVGTTSQTFDVSVTGDTDEEQNETVVAMLSNAANATISTATGTGTIVNDDGVTVSIDSPNVTEGDSGSTNLTFTATLSKASTQQVTVNYADAGTGTAISGTDYTTITGGTLTFAVGITSQTFNVSVTGDTDEEADETVIVTLSNAANATISTATGTGTITDNDGTPTVSINSPSVTEGDSGSKNLTFTVTLNRASTQQVTVDYADAGTGTATSGTDYTAISGRSLTFAAGTTSQTFDVSVTGDTTDEADETVVVTLSNAANARISTATGTGTITDNDDAPTLSINSPRVNEGDSGSTNLTFTATLSAASGQQVTVNYADAGTGTATAGTDYPTITGGVLTFPVGTTSQTFDVSVTGDTYEEPNETVVAMLSNAANATISTATGTGTIVNDDGLPALSINSPRVTEGDSGSKNLRFTVTLNKAGVDQVTVDWAEGTGGTATSGTDYTTITGGTLTFAVGTTSQTFDVSVTGDTDEEPNETVVAMLSNAANATISTATGTGTIVNDDGVTVSIDSPSVTEGDSGSTTLTFTATLSKASTQQVTVNYADAGTGTATSGTDYTAITGGTLTFAVGITSQTFDVSVTGDTDEEADETVIVTLSNAANATISTATGTGTITDNDGTPTVSIDSPSVTEGDSGSPTLTFTLTLSKASTEEVRVRFSDKGTGTATAGTDYPAFSIQWLYFQPGELTKTVSIAVTGDTVKEPNETIVVELLHPLYATIATPTGTGTITDDDTTPALSISSPRVTEGDSGSKNLTYTVSLTAAGTQQVTVDYADAGTGTATSGTDYTAITGGALTFPVGTTSQTVNVSVTGDTDVEPHETVVVSLSNASGATISTASGTGTIVNDDGASSLSVSSLSVTEGDTAIRFTVSLSAARSQSVRVTWWDTGEGTATPGEDYGTTRDSSPGRVWLTFAPGEVSKTTNQIWVRQDNLAESDETIIVAASEAADGAGRVTGTATIKDDDGAPSLSIDSPSVTEGDSGSTNLTFTATLSRSSTRQVTVDWAEGTGGTATSGTDYTAITGGTLTFAAGTTSQTFDVSVTGDTTDEADETVVVTLSNASGATISTGTGTGTITDDDDAPSLSIDSPRVTEGDSGSKDLTFTVKLSAASGEQVTVDWAEGTGGTATSGTDYTTITGGTLTFAAGITSQTFNVSVTGDTDEEPNETVVAMLSNAANATISTATGTGTIVNDDGVTISINSPSVTEGDSGSTTLTFTATLNKASAEQVTVDYADAGTGTATSGTDYTAITGGTLTFAVGTTSQTFDVSVTGDTDEETDETVIVTLSNAANATILTATGTGTITDDDRTPSLSINSPSVTEGDSGSTNLTFTVTLNKASADQVTVDWAEGTGGTATSGTDYTAITGGSLTFAVGTTSQTFNVSVTGDTTDEADETVIVTLSNAANATISTATGTGTITDNDDAPTLSINSPRVTEGDSGSTNLTFTATLSAASGKQVTVDWAEGTGGTATSGTDYTTINGGTLTFAVGTTSQTFNVSVTGDTYEEPNETVVAMLSNAANATISTATGTGTIVNDDGLPALSINSPRVTEGDSGSKNLRFTVTLNKAGVDQVTVDWAEGTGGTATSGTDYTTITGGTLTFAVGTTSQTFDVSVTGDTDEEPNETVVAMLSNAANATISTATGTGTIVNDDGVTVSIDSPSVTEGDSGSTTLTFTATLSKASTQQVTVNYADAGTGTATSGTDYTAITGGTLTFAVGTTSQTFDVSVTGDTDEETDETVIVTLSNAANATILTATGTGTITDNDGTPTVSIDSPSVTEGDSGSPTLTFTLTLSKASTEEVRVRFSDKGTGTATAGTDYPAFSLQWLYFQPGELTKTVSISVTGDTVKEPNETIVVELLHPLYATIATPTGTGTITDDDTTPALSISSPRVTEGDSGSTNLTYTVSLTAAGTQQVTVNYADAGTGTATSGTDYTAITGGALTFAVGATSQTFNVSVTGDTDVEPHETVVVSLSDAANATILTATGTGTIVNDDGASSLSVSSLSVTEADTTIRFTVTLGTARSESVRVTWWDTGEGTATVGEDYGSTRYSSPGRAWLTFAPGEVSKTTNQVWLREDNRDETDETIIVAASEAANGSGRVTGTATIEDDDGPALSIDSPSVTEGDSGSTNLTYTVSLAAASVQQVTVDWAEGTGGTATAGTDYTAITGGTLTFPVGTTSQTFDVSVTGDTTDEADETVVVTLSNAVNATISTATGTGTITDDDGPALSIDSPSVTEGDSGSKTLTFTVKLDKAAAEQVTVDYADAGTGTATSGTDYTAITGGTLTFAAGTTSQTFNVSVTGDTDEEPNETVVAMLSNAANATISTATGTGTIVNDDGVTVSIDSPSVTEGDSGSTNLTFTATLSKSSTRQVTVNYADAGTGTATSGTDYTAITGGVLTFPVGTTSQTFDVSVTGDTDEEPNETVVAMLSNAANATISTATGTGTIVNDDGVTVSIDSPSVTEGDSGSKNLTFTATLSKASTQQVTVNYADAGIGTATSGTDYTAITGGTLTFAVGATSQTFNVSVTGDTTDEADETVIVTLSNAANATISTATGTGTITNDDGVTVSIDSPSVTEGDSGSKNLTFTATLSKASTRQVTVDYADAGTGTATSGTDYTAITGGTLTFAVGTTSQTFNVSVTGDVLDESNETVLVSLSAPTNAVVSTTAGTGTGTITDDDAAPTSITLTVDDNSVGEDDGATTITVTATVDGTTRFATATTVTVSVAGSGTATAVDFAAVSSFDIEIAAGAESETETFTLTPTDDAVDETDETVTVSGTSGSLTVNSATITLTDDDDAPTAITLTVDDDTVSEGDGATTITVTAAVDGTTRFATATTVTVSVAGSGTASAVDFAAVSSFDIEIAAGAESETETFTLTPTDDTADETDETVTVSGTSGSLTVNSATITLTDDDAAPTSITLTVNDDAVSEGDGDTTITVTATVDGTTRFAEAKTVTVSVAGSGTASAVDFAAVSSFDIEIAAGAESGNETFTLTPTDDTADETDETITVSGTSGSLTVNSATISLTDDDGAPTLSIDSPSVTEGGSGSKNLTFTVTLSPASGQQVTVQYADAGTGTATSGTDYTAITGGTLTFAAGTTSQTFAVSVTGDVLDESNETVLVSLSAPTNAAVSNTAGTGTGTITDDDGAPSSITLTVDDNSVGEGDGATTITVTATVDGTTRFVDATTVSVSVAGSGTATAVDFAAVSSFDIEIAAGAESETETFTLTPTDDVVDETDETVTVRGTSSGLTVNSATITVTDDDDAPTSITLTVDDNSVGEGDGATTITVTATVDGTTRFAEATTVTVSVAGSGTATAVDFAAVTDFDIEIAAEAESETETFTLTPTDDTADETDETITVSGTSGSLTVNSATITLTDDDGTPTLSIDSPSVTEGDSGSKNLTFTVTLSAASGKQVTVDWAEGTGGTATSGTDYTAITGGTLTFAVGTTSQTFDVSVTGDTTDEADETVVVTLSNASGATIATATGTGTIVNDDDVLVSIDSPRVTEGDSGSKNLTFTVTLDKAGTEQVTVDYADARTGTATSGTDYTAITGGTLTFAVGTTSQTFDVSVTGDTDEESNETVVVTLSNAANATISTATGTGTIVNDDGVVVSIDSPSVSEGDSGSTNLTFTATLSKASTGQVTVDYADAGTGTATSGTDYTAITGGTLTFTAGTTSQTFDVSVTGDTTDEANETVVVTLSNAANATISTATGTGTIVNDDGVRVSIDSPSVTEGDSGSKNLTFTATLNKAGTEQVTVDYADAGTGTATSGTDYTAITGGTLTFTAGTTSQTFDVSVTGDTTDEADETVVVTLSNAANATIGTATGTGTITDNDPEPSLSIDSPSVTEGDSGSTNLTFKVTLSAASGKRVTVDYGDAGGGTAVPGTDYTAITDGTLTFDPGDTEETIDVSVTGDTDGEDDESVRVTLSNAANATIGTSVGTGTITDDDARRTVSIDSPTVEERDSGARMLTFTIKLNRAHEDWVDVYLRDAGTGTATPGTDYTSFPGQWVSFRAGETTKKFSVSVTGDRVKESDETVVAELLTVWQSLASISTRYGTGTITDDDTTPALSISSPRVTEGNSGSATLTYAVTLSAAISEQVTVDYADAGTGTATSGTDYTAVTGGTLTFAANETRKTIAVSVTGDTTVEPHETVAVRLSNASGATILTATGAGTIANDDGASSISISSPTVTEGTGGPASRLRFTVTLSSARSESASVTLWDARTGTATSRSDYLAIETQPAFRWLEFDPGEISQTYELPVITDSRDEADETVVMAASESRNGQPRVTGTGTITDDDPTPTLSIDSPSVNEGDSSTRMLNWTVTLSAASGREVTVAYAQGTGGTATSGTDHTALVAGTLTFAPGDTTKTFGVSVNGDTDEEPNETVVATLSGATNATLSTATGTGTIVNDDGVLISIDSPSVTEGDGGSETMTFTATLSTASTEQVTVDYADAGTGTAASGTDYTAITGGTLTFAAGTTSQTFDVSVTGDTVDEGDETILVTLSNASGATVSTATGTGTITDDDGEPTLSIDSPSVAEGDSGSKNLTWTVTLSPASGQRVTVNYADTETGTALAGVDYTTVTSGSLTFEAGTTTRTFTVSVVGDTLPEADETILVSLSSPTNATVSSAAGTGTGTITDDETLPTLSIDSPSVNEGNSGATTLTYTVTLSAVSGRAVTVDWAEGTGGTATSGTDYTAITGGTLTFPVGTTSRTFDVSVIGDTTDESYETVVVSLSNASGATIAAGTGTGTIANDDGHLLSIDSPSVEEGDSGSKNLTFTVTLSPASSQQVTVGYADALTGTAASGADYTAITAGTLTFAAGTTSQTFDVSVTGDTLDEVDETVLVTLSNALGATISTATGTGTITDNDGVPSLSIGSPSVVEGDSGSATLTWPVTLSPASGKQVTVNYADALTGTATSGTDYTAITGGTLTFAAGITSQTFDVSVTGDTDEESNETIVVSLSSPTNAVVSSTGGTGYRHDHRRRGRPLLLDQFAERDRGEQRLGDADLRGDAIPGKHGTGTGACLGRRDRHRDGGNGLHAVPVAVARFRSRRDAQDGDRCGDRRHAEGVERDGLVDLEPRHGRHHRDGDGDRHDHRRRHDAGTF